MKKYKKSIFVFILVIVTTLILPVETNAKTISEFQAEVDSYTAQLEEKRARIAKNDEEVAEIKRKIAAIEEKIEAAENEIRELQNEIDESNREIEKKTEESKRIMEYYQVSNGENAYLEYAFGAKTITDMIYRISVVEQLTDYNRQVMKELDELIKRNEQKQAELTTKKQELNKMEDELEAEKERINADSKSVRETMPAIEDQIKAAKNNVQYFKSLGCGANEDIQKCQYRVQQSSGGSIPSTNGFYRPIEYGYLTQGYSGYGGHLGIDVSSSNKSIDVYPIASGQVWKVYYDVYGALCVKIRHNMNGSYIYSTYCHFRAFGNIREGQIITPWTKIGVMGSTGWSTGPHVHLEITTCDWHSGGGCTWATYQRSSINPTRLVYFPGSWNNR